MKPWSFSRAGVSPIAVDFGGDSVKLLQIVPGDPPQFLAAGFVPLPEEARVDVASRAAFIPDAVAALMRQHGFKGRRAICSIPAFHTLVQNFQIPVGGGGDAEIQEQIGLQLRQRLNVDPTRMVVRSLPVSANGQKQEVVCFAAGRDVVMRHVAMARAAKLDVVGMHCETMAIMQAFRHLYRRKGDEERTTMFIDIGALTTKTLIAHGNQIVFAKVINAAGDHFVRQFGAQRKLDFTAARQARQELLTAPAAATPTPTPEPMVTVPQTRTPSGFAMLDTQVMAERRSVAPQTMVPPPPAETNPAADAAYAGDALDCLIDELMLCVRYHQSLFPGREVEKLVFLGGEARHVPMCQKIARALRIGAQLGDPLARLVRQGAMARQPGVDLRKPQPGWAVPMGLCLSEANL